MGTVAQKSAHKAAMTMAQTSCTSLRTSWLTMGVLAFMALHCGGTDAERPTKGGKGGGAGATDARGGLADAAASFLDAAGGRTGGTGLDCTAAIVPANNAPGGITDFSDWNGANSRWGAPTGLYGFVYDYKDDAGSSLSARVDTTTSSLRGTGQVVANGFAGMGLSFAVCTTVASFGAVAFDVSGASPGCRLDLQIKTFAEQPTNQSPAGGCDPAGTCYRFPVATDVVNLSTPIGTPTTIVVPLSEVSGWSADDAGQIVGLQWQWGGTDVSPDAGADGCPIDVSVTNIKFLP